MFRFFSKCVPLCMASSALALSVQTVSDSKCDQMKRLINSFTHGETGVAQEMIHENVIQHNSDQLQGLKGYVPAWAQSQPFDNSTFFRCFENEDYSVGHTMFGIAGFGNYVCFDIYRWNRGKIAEHWDNCQPLELSGKNKNGMTDGPKEARCAENCEKETSENVALIERFQREVSVGGRSAAFWDFFPRHGYIEHNQSLAGVEDLYRRVKELESLRPEPLGLCQSTKFVIGHGNFVLAACVALKDATDGRSPPTRAVYDLFRIQDGKIMEHWDVAQPIKPPCERNNTNGKW